MSFDLTVDNQLSANAQTVKDQSGTASSLAISNSNIGIGTITPKGKLSVTGAASNNWIAADFGDGIGDRIVAGTARFSQPSYQKTAVLGAHNNDLNAWSNLVINPDPDHGNVGIGTIIPTAKLEVKGTVKATALQLENLTTPPPGAKTVNVVVDLSTGKLYRS